MDEQRDMVSVKHYIERLFELYKEHHLREHELLSENVDHARAAIDARLEGMNEFRSQIQGERKQFVSLDKFDSLHAILTDRVTALEKAMANLAGRMAAIAAAISIGLLIVGLVLRFAVK